MTSKSEKNIYHVNSLRVGGYPIIKAGMTFHDSFKSNITYFNKIGYQILLSNGKISMIMIS